MTDGEQSPDKTTAADVADAATEAGEAIETALATADGPMEGVSAEQEHIDKFASVAAEATLDGVSTSFGPYATGLSETAKYHNKTEISQAIQTKIEERRGAGKVPLDSFVEDRLEKVIVVRTTDQKQGAEFIWDFDTFRVETRSGKDGRGHFAFGNFRDLILESGGVNVDLPVQERRGGEEWRDFMVDIIEDRQETKEVVGERTEALDELQKKIARHTAYGTPKGALDGGGIWAVREAYDLPEWWAGASDAAPSDVRDLAAETVQEIRVHESVVADILEDSDVGRSGLYHELAARGLTVPGMQGVSSEVWIDGAQERFWVLLPDIGVPKRYAPKDGLSDGGESWSAVRGEESGPVGAEAAEGANVDAENRPPASADGGTTDGGEGGLSGVGDLK